VYQAEDAALTGLSKAAAKTGYKGKGYVKGFDKVGDKCRFNVTPKKSGAYIIKIRYNTNTYQKLSCYVNGTYLEDLKLSQSEQNYATWTEYTIFTWLNRGKNTIDFKYLSVDSRNVNLDELSMALYSTKGGSLPGCYPPGSDSIVNDSLLTYSPDWTYYNYVINACDCKRDLHWCTKNKSYVKYTFKGTGVEYINEMSSDLGKVDIYIDNMTKPKATVNCNSPKKLYQQVVYRNTSLPFGTHTIKIVKKSGKNASIDALKIIK
jgi:hypothetical protein